MSNMRVRCLIAAENTAARERCPGRLNEFSQPTTQPTGWIGLYDFEKTYARFTFCFCLKSRSPYPRGRKQRIRSAVNDRIGIEPNP
jgi:hypothetical protein